MFRQSTRNCALDMEPCSRGNLCQRIRFGVLAYLPVSKGEKAMTSNAVAIAGFSLAQAVLEFLNKKQLAMDEEVEEILSAAANKLVGSEGGREANAQASSLLLE